jgi:hypothetical protein
LHFIPNTTDINDQHLRRVKKENTVPIFSANSPILYTKIFMSQPTNLLAGSALGQQTCFVKYNINLLACSAPGRQTCRLAHEDFCLNNWAIVYE